MKYVLSGGLSMPLTDAKCTSCGAPLKVDSSKDAAICRYCGSAFIVEKAIQNYYFSGNITNNINADVVNVMGQSEFVIRAGELEEYHGESMDVVIPAHVKSIKGGAFANCINLNSVQLPEGLREIGDSAFAGCRYLKSINIPSTIVSIGSGAFYGCDSLNSITLPNGLREISGSFSGCTGLTSITIPDSVTTIGSYAFSGCTSLTSVTIPDSVTVIDNDAFSGCTSLTSVTIPDSVTTIGSGAFYGCTSLISITIPNGVTSIGHRAFEFCTSLMSLNIPDSVNENHYDSSFLGCTSLKDVKINILPNRVIYPNFFQGTPFYPKYQKMLKDHGYCPICHTKLKGLLFKSCPHNHTF